jgi:hypothetical protein
VYSGSVLFENKWPDSILFRILVIIPKLSLVVFDITQVVIIPLKSGFDIKGRIILPNK